MHMRNRLIVGPMEKSLANLDGSLNERYIAYARRRAMGGAALIQLESTYVSPEGRGNPYQVGCHGDHVIPSLTRMAGELHRHGAKLAMELHHGGRQASAIAHNRHPRAPLYQPPRHPSSRPHQTGAKWHDPGWGDDSLGRGPPARSGGRIRP